MFRGLLWFGLNQTSWIDIPVLCSLLGEIVTMFRGLVGKGDTAFVLAPERTLEINLSDTTRLSQITLSIRLSLSTSSQYFDGDGNLSFVLCMSSIMELSSHRKLFQYSLCSGSNPASEWWSSTAGSRIKFLGLLQNKHFCQVLRSCFWRKV